MISPDAPAAAADADRVGFVFPVYMFTLPLIVEKFLRSVALPSNAKLFTIVTCGGNTLGTIGMVHSILHKRGHQLTSGFSLPMVNNYVPLGIPQESKQVQKLEKAKSYIKDINGIINSGKRNICGNFFLSRWISALMFKLIAIHQIPKLDKSYFADSNCNGCGICAKVCPAKNIELVDGHPKWLHKCEQCWACLHWCPKAAIQYGKGTAGKLRYHHPDVKVQDMVQEAE